MRKCVKCKIQKHRISQCLWTKNRGKWQRSETPSLSFRHFHFPTNFHFFSSLLISNEDELNADERCEKVRQTDWLHWLQQKWSCLSKKMFQKNFSPLENLELVMLDPAISCLDGLGKPCYHFPRARWGRLGRDCLCDNETRMRKQIQKTVTMRTIQILYIV